MTQHLAEIFDEIVKRVLTVVQPEKIIVFGSVAKEANKSGSDIDIAVVVQNVHSKRKTTMDIYMALEGIMVPVDVIVLTSEELDKYRQTIGTIIPEIVKNGKSIYEPCRT